MQRSLHDRRLRGRTAALLGAILLLPGAWTWADGTVTEPPSRAGHGAVRVLIETIVVDGLGTNSVAEDAADLFPGQSGSLGKSIALKGRGGSEYPQEQVELSIRVTLSDDAAPACPILLAIVATGAPLGGPAPTPADAERKALTMTLQTGESQMTPAYLSPWTGARITLRISCGEVQPAAVPEAVPAAPSSMAFDIALERGEDDALPRLLRTDRLFTTLGSDAGSLFSSNTPLADTADGERRYRREKIEARVSPRILSGGRLQVDVTLRGEVATISASGTDGRHPIDVEKILVLAAGESGEIGVTITASPEEGGWSRVQFLLRVTGRF